MHPIFGIEESVTELGPCGVFGCPDCGKQEPFDLRHLEFAAGMLGISVPGGPLIKYELRCSVCGYERFVPDEQAANILKAQALWKQHGAGGLPSADYVRELAALDIGVLNELNMEAETWKCEKCREENPANFMECWNCQSPRADPPAGLEASDKEEMPELPKQGPWGADSQTGYLWGA